MSAGALQLAAQPTVIGGFPVIPKAGDGHLYVKCINVGLGDCTAIVMPNGKFALIDCGTARRAGVTSADVYNALPMVSGKLRKIDLIVMTHPDRDHYSMFGDVVSNNPVAALVHSMNISAYKLYQFRRWVWQVGALPPLVEISVNPTTPAELDLLDGSGNGSAVHLYAVAANVPYQGNQWSMESNAASVVIALRDDTAGRNYFVGCADAICTTENFMLDVARRPRIANTDVVRVAHHGSDTSSRTTFIQAVNPSFGAVVSSSQDNGQLCLPKQSVVTRWLNQLPGGAPSKTVGYWQDGAGTECNRNALTDEEERVSLGVGDEELGWTPYNYGQANYPKRLWETFLDGSITFRW